MVWIAILALAAWVYVEHRRITGLMESGGAMKDRGAPKAVWLGAPPAAGEAAPRPQAPQPAPVAPARPAVRGTAIPPSPRPVPSVSPPPALRPTVTRASLEAWLSQKGLAWIGGSAMVVGAAFLVGYAVDKGVFTAPIRIGAAVLLGFAMLAAGEMVRRGRLAGFGGHRLAASILAGAGASTLYGATFAAYGLYGFISAPVCAGLLAAISAGLFGLALLQGEALAVLAIGGAFAVPLITHGAAWPVTAMTLYLGVLAAVGAAVSWTRGWRAAAWTNLIAVLVWAGLAACDHDTLKCLALGLEPLAVTVLLAYVRPRAPFGAVGPGAIVVAALASLVALADAYQGANPQAVALIACAAPLLVAALQRKGQAPVLSLGAPAAAFALAALSARLDGHHSPTLTALWCAQVFALDLAAMAAAWSTDRRAEASALGALGSLALGVIAGAGVDVGPWAALGPAAACAALALGALALARDRGRPKDPRALEIWGGASAAALLATLAVALTWRWAPFGFALAALGLALTGRTLRWRSISLSAAAAAAAGLGALLTPDMLTHALSGRDGAIWLLTTGLIVAAASFAAARILAREPLPAEALRTLSPLAALTGAFVFLRWLAGAGQGLPLDPLTEASIRTLLIAAAGLIGLARLGAERTAFSRWRAHGLMAAAAAHGVFMQAFIYNPRWGVAGDLAGGVVLLNGLAVAYLAPAVLFGLAAARTWRTQRTAGRAYALVATLFGLLWAFLEIRRLFAGPHLGGGLETIRAPEALACSLVLLALPALGEWAARIRTRDGAHPLWSDLAQSLAVARVIAIGFTVLMTGLWSNPCWGGADQTLGGVGELAWTLLAYAAVAVLIDRLARNARAAGGAQEAAAETVASILMGMVFIALAVRASFHGPALGLASPTGQLETWTYSAAAAAAGLALISLSRAQGKLYLRAGLAILLATTAKVFIIDTASLSGVIRAGSFLALGVLLLLGALTARRTAQKPPIDPPAAQA